jgi:acyl-CoA synthetase (AMP-forming)/AMP-acid ligase II/acyl carrier protein
VSRVAKPLRDDPAGQEAGGPAFSCLPDLLGHYGRTAPSRVAILAPGHPSLTYDALWARTTDVVHGLRRMGIRRSDRVAVVLPDGAETAVTMIAVAAGAVCVPLHLGFTVNECQRYFAELRIAALVTRSELNSASQGLAQSLGIPIIDLSLPGEGLGAFSIAGAAERRIPKIEFASGPDDAFILLTSGSTSRPKMVPLTHASVCLSACNVGAAVSLEPQDRLLHVLPLVHGHGLISGLLGSLAAGSSVVCPSGFNAAAFFDWLSEFRPTWYTAVPAIHRAILLAAAGREPGAQRTSLRFIRSASSTLPSKVLRGLEATFGVPVIDTYGMTEAATQIAANPMGRRKLGSVGRSAGAEIAICDGKGRQLRAGARGEIVLRGPTITRGYENDAVATASAFRDGWFRTGDLGYLDPEGYLFIVGRIKDVIDRGGQKVAPAEVEEALLSHPDVADAAVFAVPHKRLGSDVAAAVVLRPGSRLSAQKLRTFVRDRLAGFKVPGLIRIVPEIPKGPGGKVRRGELAAVLAVTPPIHARGAKQKALPGSELERQLAKIWADLLELKQIGVDQDFFALGADSIIIMQALSRLRTDFGVDLALMDIFDAPTVGALAARLERSVTTSAASPGPGAANDMARGERKGPQRASILQEQVLRIDRALPGLPQFNRPVAYRLRGALNVPALKRSLAEVVSRHDALRTRFHWRSKQPMARVAPAASLRSFFVVEDLAAKARTRRGRTKASLLLQKAKLKAEQDALTAFGMDRAPLLRARLLRLGADDHVLLLVVHDIAVDGWSMGILMDEVSALYAAFATGKPAQLPIPALQFPDFARWQHRWAESDAASRNVAYWKERLRGASPVFSTAGDADGALLATDIARQPIHLPKQLAGRLHALSHSQGATSFMTLLAGFKALLMVRSGRNDLCIATTMANRSQPLTERAVGPFSNTTLIRTRMEPDLSFGEALRRVRDAVLEAYAKQELPFDVLAARLAEDEGLDAAGLTRVFFGIQNTFRRPLRLRGVTVRPFADRQEQSVIRVDSALFSVTLRETPSGISGVGLYKSELFAPDLLRHWIADYAAILAKAAASPEMSLGRLTE